MKRAGFSKAGMLASGRGLRALALAASSLALAAASAEDCALGMPGSVRTRPLRLAALGAESPALLAPGGRDLLPAHSALHAAAGPGGAREGHDAARSRLVYLSQQGRVQQCVRLRGGSDLMKTKPAFLAKMQDGLASSRAAILWVIKGLLAAFTGLLTTSAVMVAFEFTAHKIRPVTDLAEMIPDYLAGLVLAGAVVGSVLGSWVLTKLSPSHPTLLALAVSSLFTAAQYMNLQVVAHPRWYKFLGLASFIPPYVLTSFFGSGGLSSTPPRGSTKSLRFASPKKSAASPSRGTDAPSTPGKSSSRTPSTAKSKSAPEDKAPKTPKSSTKASASTPAKTTSRKEPKTPKGGKTPKK